MSIGNRSGMPAFWCHVELGALPVPTRRLLLQQQLCLLNEAPASDSEAMERLCVTQTSGFTGGDLQRLLIDAQLRQLSDGDTLLEALCNSRVHPASLSTREGLLGRSNNNSHTVNYSHVAGFESLKQSLQQSIADCAGVVLYGPSGCGKTLLALAAAGEAKLPVLCVRAVDIISPMVGQSERKLVDAFERARTLAPSIVILDQLEVLAPKTSGGVGTAQKRPLTATQTRLLSVLNDELQNCQSAKVTVMATVISLDMCNASALADSRLGRHYLCWFHSTESLTTHLLAVLALSLSRIRTTVTAAVLLPFLPNVTRFSPAFIESACHEAALLALRQSMDSDCVTLEHLRTAFCG